MAQGRGLPLHLSSRTSNVNTASSTDPLLIMQHGIMDRKKVAKNALAYTLIVFAIASVIAVYILRVRDEVDMLVYLRSERDTVDLQTQNIGRDIQGVTADLLLLSRNHNVAGLWGNDGSPQTSVALDLADDFLNFAIHRRLYDQVRLLDEHGKEIVRVNYSNGLPAIVPQGRLQNKKGRYYFTDAYRLGSGEVFVSPLDLNIENGEIERPLKPMIRFATPVFDRRGEKKGIVLLNYFGGKLLESLYGKSQASRGSRAMLLNADGYWLYGPDTVREWAFMYEDRKDVTFPAAYPEAWRRIGSEVSCQFAAPQGLFTANTIHPLLSGQKSSVGSIRASSPSLAALEPDEYY